MGLENFSTKLSNARREMGFTQEELALRLGVTSQAVSKWERGNGYPDIELLYSIAAVLGCGMDELCDFKQNRLSSYEEKEEFFQREIHLRLLKDPILLEVGSGLVETLRQEQKRGFDQIGFIRKELAEQCGIYVPAVRIRDSMQLEENEYQIRFRGVLVARGEAYGGRRFLADREQEREEEILAKEPVNQRSGVWRRVERDDLGDGKDGGMEAFAWICAHLRECILRNYDRILNRQMVKEMVGIVGEKYPAIVEGVVPEKVSFRVIQKVMIGLVKRGVALNPLDRLIELMEDGVEEGMEVEQMEEMAARELKEY